MSNAIFKVPLPLNEPILNYAPGSPEKVELKKKLTEMRQQRIDIPLIIGGEEIRTGNTTEIRAPHDHSILLACIIKPAQKKLTWQLKQRLKPVKAGRKCHGNREQQFSLKLLTY